MIKNHLKEEFAQVPYGLSINNKGECDMDNKFVNLNEEEKKNLIKRAADLGYKYEKMYGNCPQCTVAAIQEVFEIANDNIFKQVYGLGAGGGSYIQRNMRSTCSRNCNDKFYLWQRKRTI